MKNYSDLENKIKRLAHWSDRINRVIVRSIKDVEEDYLNCLQETEEKKNLKKEEITAEEENIKAEIEKSGREFVRQKYVLEKETNNAQIEINKLNDDFERIKLHFNSDLKRLNEGKIKTMASYESQKSALQDLYEQKRKSLNFTKTKLENELHAAQENLKKARAETQRDMAGLVDREGDKISQMRNQLQAKKDGWGLALEKMKKELELIVNEREEVQKRLSTVRSETEGELSVLRQSISLSIEQLEVDKATIIEKAEDDQRKCEKDIADLTQQVEKNEKELQRLILGNDTAIKDKEEEFLREEEAIKEAVKSESEKRDYEKKLYEQDKKIKSQELAERKEEYEKKKWYWDNQIRNLMMKKSVQEAEFEAVRLRTDRESRSSLKSLEAKRDELRQRLSDIKTRHNTLTDHHNKEQDLMKQRWKWRKERLWGMWQSRLDVIRKERMVIQEQLEALETSFEKTRNFSAAEEARDQKRADNLEQSFIHLEESNFGAKKQREIQNELEKTRILAQIKECEGLIDDWKDRLKNSQEDVERYRSKFGDQLNFIEKFYQEEEKETDIFLNQLKKVLARIDLSMQIVEVKKDAA